MKLLFILILLLSSNLVLGENNESKVSLPLKEFLETQKKLEMPSVTTFELLRLEGNMAQESALSFRLEGRSAGRLQEKILLSELKDLEFNNCKGNAIIRLEKNSVFIFPKADPFSLTCNLIPKRRDSFVLEINGVMFFENRINGAETIITNENEENKTISVVKKMANEKRSNATVTANAQYKITIFPDSINFDYHFILDNPNRNKAKYHLSLKNNEQVEQIKTSLEYNEAGGEIELSLTPGDNAVTLTGKLPNSKFVPLINSQQQYLLIQSHPLIQVKANTKWQRISVEQSKMNASFGNADAFYLTSEQSFSWISKKLEVFSALGYTVDQANYLIYLPTEGDGVVESTFHINNQGNNEIAFKPQGRLLYLEIDGQVKPLNKDENGNLLVATAPGQHQINIQYQLEHPLKSPASYQSISLMKPPAIMAQGSATIRYAPAWKMPFSKFYRHFQTSFTINDFIWAAVFLAFAFAVFSSLNIQRKKWFVSCVTLFVFCSDFYFLLILLFLILLAIRYRENLLQILLSWYKSQFSWRKIFLSVGITSFVLVAVIIVAFIAHQQLEIFSQGSRNEFAAQVSQSMYKEKVMPMVNSAPLKRDREEGATEASIPEQMEQPDYQGLPARISIPSQGNQSYYSMTMLGADKPLNLTFGLYRMTLEYLFELLVAAFIAYWVYLQRKEWQNFLKINT